MRSAPTIAFDWRPSRGWRALRWSALAIGVLCVLWSSLEPWGKFALAVLVAWLEWRTLRVESWWQDSQWRLDGEGAWHWRRADMTEGDAALTQATLLGPLIVLNLRDSSGRVDLPIWPDQLDAETHRRLRVRLAQSNAVVVRSPLL